MTTLSFEDNGFDPDSFRTKVELVGPNTWRTVQADGTTQEFTGPMAEKAARDHAQQVFMRKLGAMGV